MGILPYRFYGAGVFAAGALAGAVVRLPPVAVPVVRAELGEVALGAAGAEVGAGTPAEAL